MTSANNVLIHQMKKTLYISLTLVLFLFASAKASLACSCAASAEPERKQVQKAFSGSAAIFSGKVVEVKDAADGNKFIVRIEVDRSWKGGPKGEVLITTAKDSAMCGYAFTVGQKYLVYANGRRDDLFVENCSRTAVLKGNGDTKYLAKLKRRKRSG